MKLLAILEIGGGAHMVKTEAMPGVAITVSELDEKRLKEKLGERATITLREFEGYVTLMTDFKTKDEALSFFRSRYSRAA